MCIGRQSFGRRGAGVGAYAKAYAVKSLILKFPSGRKHIPALLCLLLLLALLGCGEAIKPASTPTQPVPSAAQPQPAEGRLSARPAAPTQPCPVGEQSLGLA